MRIEHLALMMEDPVSAAKWYSDNLDFTILKQMDVSPFAHFIADNSKRVMLEIFRLPDKEVPDYKLVDPAIMHLGFLVDDINEKFQKLVSSGATIVDEIIVTKNGDMVAMLRDPWGLPIQLIKRKKSMVS